MKTSSFKTMSFGFSAVNAGQRNVVVEPQVIAVSTEGSFRVTPPVSRVLGLANGDYVMFINNVDSIDSAFATNAPEVVAFAEAQGLELGSTELAIALHKEFDMWAIAKGIVEYDTKGNQKTTTERLTRKDKITFVSQRFEELLEQAMNSGDAELVDALSREGISKEEQIDILITCVQPKEIIKHKGSKLANPAGLTGVGVSLTFTDSNVWKQLKADMGDDATKMNRVFEADIENVQDVVLSNGYEDVTVKAIALGDYTDKEPSRIMKTSEAEVEE